MITCGRLDLEKFVVYEKASYEFADGTTIIRGPNRSGKSLIFSAWGSLLYGAPPIMRARRQSKQMHIRPGSKVSYSFRSNGHDIEIVQGLSQSSVKYSITIDGEVQSSHRNNDNMELIRELVPAPEDLFYSTAFISSGKSNPLHQGTGVERLRYLESMFDFQNFDHLRVRLQELLNQSRKAVSEAEALKAELRSLPTGTYLSESGLLRLGIAVKKISDESTAHRKAESARGAIEALSKSTDPDKSVGELEAELETLIQTRDRSKENVKKFQDEAREYHRFQSSQSTLARLQSELDQIEKPEIPVAKIEKMAAKHEKLYVKYRTHMENCEIAAKDIKSIHNLWKDAPPGTPVIDDFYADTGQNIATQKLIITRAKNLERLDGKADCPTCGKPVDAKHIKGLMKEAERAQAIYEFMQKADMFSFEPADAAQVQSATDDWKEASKERNRLARLLNSAQQYAELKNKIKSLKDSIPKNLNPDAETEMKRHVAVVQGLESKIKALMKSIEARKEIERLKPLLSKEASLSHDATSTLISAYSGIKSESKLLNKSESRREKIKKRLKELGRTAEYEDILSALVDAYGPRGLRVDQMDSIARVLETSFNQFAPSIFPEPIYFNFHVSPSRADLTVERNSLNQSDAALMSNSEVRCFQILCFCALSPYIPARYRFDSVVLDELEATMDPVTRKLFVTEAIPRIQEAVRSLTLITPLPESEFFIEGARTVNVIKERSRSRLEIA